MDSFFIAALVWIAAVQASPTLVSRDSGTLTALSTAQVSAIDTYTNYAASAYCSPAVVQSWTCASCNANKQFKVVASGGDGNTIQYWYVGYDPSLNTVVAAHQGTNASEIKPVLTDLKIVKDPLDPSLFPGISSDIEVHSGFKQAHAQTALNIHSAVQLAMSRYGTNSVTMVGHSLGAAISLLDSVYLPLVLPRGTTFKTVLYGCPRVGNQAFADYVDAHANVMHINNKEDPIPVLPPKMSGFEHPNGEVHITDSGAWAVCPGHDNPSKSCSTGDVSDILFSHESDHDGPYNGIMISCHA